jgi:hypothetical protein
VPTYDGNGENSSNRSVSSKAYIQKQTTRRDRDREREREKTPFQKPFSISGVLKTGKYFKISGSICS